DTAEKLKRPYNEVYRLIEAMNDVVDVNSLGQWFQEPNDAFGGLKPLEVIERGEIDRLWNMVYELRSGMPG
ncbi:MAG: MbcA/ParS/Xre antitoxin family protein, partial [Pirellula sp.]|nr:MbcA/ParS/Xre antitoxin family protein [Pirellula sp.]